ncbi:cohesin domain-containing protein [Natrinema gelatinilyticum]|uniref:cohesin domain-containing protein n=1 Tax=Natrinema gelatinilyticum TaxID=2961571 RepID=UPI0020C3E78D|nr:cohesin domain-containing protein [Natrinema gelatinilyticum]
MRSERDDPGRRFERRARERRTAILVAGTTVLLTLSMVGIVGTVTAIDQVAILSPDRSQPEVAPGDTIEIDVTLQSRGGHGGEGVSNVTLVAQYNPEYLEITDVERGPWLEGNNTEIHAGAAVAHEQGTAVLEQRRVPAAGGATGNGTIATLTVRVAADAPTGTTTISFDHSDIDFTGDYPPYVQDESVTVAIDGGDEPLESFDHADPNDLALDPELAESNSAAGSNELDGKTAENGGEEPIPGFTPGFALAAIALAVVGLWAGRYDHRT